MTMEYKFNEPRFYTVQNNNKHIVVVGGGSAGWITALLTQAYHPNSTITLIESPTIPIIGAGEGTTPNFIGFLDIVKIPFSKLVKECDATVKTGIVFSNWNNDGESYFHSFDTADSYKDISPSFDSKIGIPYNKTGFCWYLSNINKVPFTHSFNYMGYDQDPILSMDCHYNWAAHFNAHKLAQCLSNVGQDRGIRLIRDDVVDIKNNKDGTISELILNSNTSIEPDFVFDCTGFKRKIIGEHYGTEWESYEDTLPLKKAIPFFIDIKDGEEIPPYTEAVSMKFGWMWKIPTQKRYGCGYVFDPTYITPEEAKEELRQYFNNPNIEFPRVIDFNPGSFRKTIVNNCMAVGLSQSFVEPLEATSIFVSLLNLHDFLSHGIFEKNNLLANKLNNLFQRRNKDVQLFLNFHYGATNRQDTEFWKRFEKNHYIEEAKSNVEYLDQFISNKGPIDYLISNYDNVVTNELWGFNSWTQVFCGLKRNNNEDINHILLEKINHNYNNYSTNFIHHNDFLSYLKNEK